MMKKDKKFNYYITYVVKSVLGTHFYSSIIHLPYQINRACHIEKIEELLAEDHQNEFPDPFNIVVLFWSEIAAEGEDK